MSDPRVLYVIELFDEEAEEWMPQADPECLGEAEDIFVERETAQEILDEYVDDGGVAGMIRIVEYIPRFVMKETT